ncbi:HET-domain-containing protein [Setomelanomma holmii]|uniref:HET-domain-containing protein n=1 Tax=Setomelanomma holmii TaxID=210430 RepID=A0A9P4HDW3_9PLEO|nr:HET-domain-containing protein [Setomelanomma holmii]
MTQLHTFESYQEENRLSMSQIPSTIKDAMEICRQMGETFLWIDRLCIVQDDKKDVEGQLQSMSAIFHRVKLTTVTTCDDSMNEALPGVSVERSETTNCSEVVAMHVRSRLDTLFFSIHLSAWSKRAWWVVLHPLQGGPLFQRLKLESKRGTFLQASLPIRQGAIRRASKAHEIVAALSDETFRECEERLQLRWPNHIQLYDELYGTQSTNTEGYTSGTIRSEIILFARGQTAFVRTIGKDRLRILTEHRGQIPILMDMDGKRIGIFKSAPNLEAELLSAGAQRGDGIIKVLALSLGETYLNGDDSAYRPTRDFDGQPGSSSLVSYKDCQGTKLHSDPTVNFMLFGIRGGGWSNISESRLAGYFWYIGHASNGNLRTSNFAE